MCRDLCLKYLKRSHGNFFSFFYHLSLVHMVHQLALLHSLLVLSDLLVALQAAFILSPFRLCDSPNNVTVHVQTVYW